jgi:hypothetical protein
MASAKGFHGIYAQDEAHARRSFQIRSPRLLWSAIADQESLGCGA